MRTRLVENITSFFILPTIVVGFNKEWSGQYEIAIVWFKWYACLEWGYES